MQPHGQPAVPLLLEELVRAAVPDLDRAGAVLPRRDRPLEVAVLERMVLDMHGEVPLSAPERDAFRHRPARERTASLESEVVVQAPRVVALDRRSAGARSADAALAERLGCPPGAPLAPVLVEAHLWIVAIERNAFFTNCTQILTFSLLSRRFSAGDKPVERVESVNTAT